jgi:RNA ligase (TIGR02306 family)
MDLDETNETNTDTIRKLASIKIINDISKHPNADNLELTVIDGWQIVTRIGEVQKGDKVIYCEIDSLLPGDAPWLPEAVKSRIDQQEDKEWYRLKTAKLRKEISQGLIVPISDCIKHMIDYDLDTNVTTELGIKKYEASAFSGNYGIKNFNTSPFPSHLISKTDEPRVQSSAKLFNVLRAKPYYMSVKCDGTSGTFLVDPETHELIVCSRNQTRCRPNNLDDCPYWSIAVKYDIETKLKELGGYIALQGEVCGPKIQKNLLGLKDIELFVFNVIDIRDKRILPYLDFIRITKQIGVKTVPIEEIGDSFHSDSIKDILLKAEGMYKGTKNQREGLVIRSQNCDISFKVISNAYLLKYE